MADLVVTIGTGKDYPNLLAAVIAERLVHSDLVGDGNTITFLPEEEFADGNAVDFGTWITDSTHYITVRVATAYRHEGRRGTGYRIHGAFGFGHCMSGIPAYTVIDGVAACNTDGTGDGFMIINSPTTIKNCFVYDSRRGVYAVGYPRTYYIINSIFVGNVTGIYLADDGATSVIYNCTFLNNDTYGIDYDAFDTMVIKNNYSGGNGTAAYHAAGTLAHTTCHADDTTGDTQTAVVDCDFTNTTPGSEDLKIANTSALRAVGTDLHADAAYAFNTDFEGNTIPNGEWGVGADYIAAGGTIYELSADVSFSASGSADLNGIFKGVSAVGFNAGVTAQLNGIITAQSDVSLDIYVRGRVRKVGEVSGTILLL